MIEFNENFQFPDPQSLTTLKAFAFWREELERIDDLAARITDEALEFDTRIGKRYTALLKEPYTCRIETEFCLDPHLNGTVVVVRLVRDYGEKWGLFVEQERTFIGAEACVPQINKYVASLRQEYPAAAVHTIDERDMTLYDEHQPAPLAAAAVQW